MLYLQPPISRGECTIPTPVPRTQHGVFAAGVAQELDPLVYVLGKVVTATKDETEMAFTTIMKARCMA